ncbi:RsmD family RNA methyltransferase, partial [Campylobacter upsaliensis]|nr:RsmD family RNA methyltransferase [Campylobacter upsaliensis]
MNKSSQKLYTAIESGRFKGKKLLLPSLEKTRSTKSIVKACVFNVLRENLRGKIFIEAFGGSALMAAEALSNYALKAYAIELD